MFCDEAFEALRPFLNYQTLEDERKIFAILQALWDGGVASEDAVTEPEDAETV